jgi:hypothetical protein
MRQGLPCREALPEREPRTHHIIVGSHPKIDAAVIGPTIGPAPAIEEK